MMNEILKITDMSVAYEQEPPVLKNVDLNVYQNDFLGVIGPNGGGKTTLLKAILGLIEISSGAIEFFKQGKRTNKLNIGYLPQINRLDKKFPISVYDIILSGLTPKKRFFSTFSAEQKNKVVEIACKMGLEGLLNRPIGELSGGQLQRALLGRSIADEPDLLILDEPNSYIDKHFETSFYNILSELNNDTAIILVSHDIDAIKPQVKHIAFVNGTLDYYPTGDMSPDW